MRSVRTSALTFAMLCATLCSSCSYVVEFDRSLLLDAGTDAEVDAASATDLEAAPGGSEDPDAGLPRDGVDDDG